MHACVSLAAVAMVVTSSAERQSLTWLVCGTVLSVTAICMMIYAYRVFLWRSGMIAARNGAGAHNYLGPAVLTGGVLLAIGVGMYAVIA